ncbi:MAG: hypothetical protein B6244_04670 [Candidatus Cloacimonetes bacterium 4572_55]|nr:MAG: hypothetical protein B6244_04670 [Candidatus Cloacimonetes bacterium 4572_55]
MALKEIVWKVSDTMYDEMTQVQKELSFPNLMDLVSQAVQRYMAEVQHETWWQEFRKLQQQVRASGGFQLGQTKEEIIANLREQRRQIFESDYANMY